MIYFLMIAAIFVVDRVSKIWVSEQLELYVVHEIIPDFFSLTYCTNTGAAWGMFSGGRWFFVVFTIAVLAVLVFVLFKTKEITQKIAYSFLIGGAIGNLYDRIMTGKVVDFFDFSAIGFSAIFNVADIFVVVGTILMAIGLIREARKENAKTNHSKYNGGTEG